MTNYVQPSEQKSFNDVLQNTELELARIQAFFETALKDLKDRVHDLEKILLEDSRYRIEAASWNGVVFIEKGARWYKRYDISCAVSECCTGCQYYAGLVHDKDLSVVGPTHPLFASTNNGSSTADVPEGQVEDGRCVVKKVCIRISSGKRKQRFRFVIILVSGESASVIAMSEPCEIVTRPQQLPPGIMRNRYEAPRNARGRDLCSSQGGSSGRTTRKRGAEDATPDENADDAAPKREASRREKRGVATVGDDDGNGANEEEIFGAYKRLRDPNSLEEFRRWWREQEAEHLNPREIFEKMVQKAAEEEQIYGDTAPVATEQQCEHAFFYASQSVAT